MLAGTAFAKYVVAEAVTTGRWVTSKIPGEVKLAVTPLWVTDVRYTTPAYDGVDESVQFMVRPE